MFSGIRWKFIIVYLALILLAMSIVGVFIIDKLENQQVNSLTLSMERHIETIVESSSYIGYDDWNKFEEEIQATLNEWRLGATETLYIISGEDVPVIIASTSKEYNKLIGENALSSRHIDTELLLDALDGEKSSSEVKNRNDNTSYQHLAYPVISDIGRVKGVLYMTSDLTDVNKTVKDSKSILTNATLIAMSITGFLGFIIASNVTNPISDLTVKAEEMAKGDFDQIVEVKSDDEIGQLASMFNYLTKELKHKIQEIDFERSKLETIFNYMAEGVVAINKDKEIIHINIHAKKLLGIKKNDLENNIKISLKTFGIDHIDYGDKNSLEGTVNKKIDDYIFKIKYAPFKTEDDNIGGLIIVLQDMTKEFELDNMRKEFVANVSHELKTPITTIKSYTETIIESDMDEETRVMFLNIINDECDRMNRLVQDLLKLSNLDYKRVKWNKTYIDINDIIEDVVMKLKLSSREKNIQIDKNLYSNISKVKADRDSIEQVFLNIISNAINYTGEGGNIWISSKEEEAMVVATIKDNGLGISDKDLDRIFERFYRAEKGRSRELGGTGLGLSIAKEIIESHKGSLLIESELDKGTNVIIKLPIGEKVLS